MVSRLIARAIECMLVAVMVPPSVKRLPAQALDAYLRQCRHSSLSAALMTAGVDQKYLSAETISTKIIGRIARRWAMTPEQLVVAVEEHAKRVK